MEENWGLSVELGRELYPEVKRGKIFLRRQQWQIPLRNKAT